MALKGCIGVVVLRLREVHLVRHLFSLFLMR